MKNILITGATGNIGSTVIKQLSMNVPNCTVFAGVRDIQKAKQKFKEFPNLQFVQFDFENPTCFNAALKNITTVFLLRPPHLSKIETFTPLVKAIKDNGIKELIFLSVQGAEKSKIIPHNKIERLIVREEIDHIFIRPGYFMQNLTTTLNKEIKDARSITLPAGKAKFNWVDIENIAEVTIELVKRFDEFKNQALEVTGNENESFGSVVEIINREVEDKITYQSVGPIKFYRLKRKQGMKKGLILVMLLLHYLPRFQKEPKISKNIQKLTGHPPTSLKEFIQREKHFFQ